MGIGKKKNVCVCVYMRQRGEMEGNKPNVTQKKKKIFLMIAQKDPLFPSINAQWTE